jgi:hypothetical protein
VLQLWSAPTPQGFEYRQSGASQRQLADFEEIALVTVKTSRRKGKSGEQKVPGSS